LLHRADCHGCLWREWSAAASTDLRVWFGFVRFRPEQICAVTDSVSEHQRLVRLISKTKYNLGDFKLIHYTA